MKNYLKLISIFVISISILLAYAILPPEIAEKIHLKQIGLNAIRNGNKTDIKAILDDTNDTTPVTDREPTDTTTQRVFMFGDSMTALLAARFADYAKENGHLFTCVTWNASTTKTWAESDTITAYMRRIKPTHVFVCLGSNELFTKDETNRKKYIKMIKDKIGKVPVIWIGPPNWQNDYGLNQWILDIMGEKAFFPSLKYTYERQKDGAHPTYASGVKWMDNIVKWINNGHSVHPFRLKVTTLKHSGYKQIIIPVAGTHKAQLPKDSISNTTKNDITEMETEQTAEKTTAVIEEKTNVHKKDTTQKK